MICFSRFHRAGAGHDDEFIAADFHAVDAHRGVLLLEFLADEFVRRGNADGALDAGRGFERFQAGGHVAHPTTPITTRSSPSMEWTL